VLRFDHCDIRRYVHSGWSTRCRGLATGFDCRPGEALCYRVFNRTFVSVCSGEQSRSPTALTSGCTATHRLADTYPRNHVVLEREIHTPRVVVHGKDQPAAVDLHDPRLAPVPSGLGPCLVAG
jgi:hypothetical protein